MHRNRWIFVLTALLIANPSAWAQIGSKPTFQGEWRTSFGVVKITQNGNEVTGTYGQNGANKIKGKVDGKVLTYEFSEGTAKGDAKWTLAESGRSFEGGFQVRGGRGGVWSGWQPDPSASKGEPAKFSGFWLTSLGLMELKQEGANVTGKFALRGDSTIDGKVKGRELTFTFKAFRGGKGFFDLSSDGKTLEGAAADDGSVNWFGWSGRPAPEYSNHTPLVAGKSIDGSTDNFLTYTVRAPEGYDPLAKRFWPAVVILHGSNMNGRSYVETIASAFPDVARDFILIGINGERPSNTTNDPRFNFSYVNFVGKSTYGGFPGTDRESPALVSNALTELKAVYPVSKYLVGGHSQGGFLTYSLLMNYPDVVAGAFPISSGLIFQCEPSAFTDETVKTAQRKVPLVIVHGKTDPVVDPSMSRYAAELFREASFPAFRFLEPEQGGHMFALLPVNQAIRWLDALTTDDPAKLLEFADISLKEKRPSDAIAALARLRQVKLLPAMETKAKALAKRIDALASPKAKTLLAQIKSGKPGWIDAFLTYRDDYQFADAAKEVMTAFDGLRAQQTAPAQTLYNDARGLFQQGKSDEGYKKYQEIVDQDYASPLYRTVKRAIAEKG